MKENHEGALVGIKVLDLSQLLPGPFCSMILADHGADVIAVGYGSGGLGGLYLDCLNRNKRHMSLNLKTETGREIFFRLARDADVILEGFRPGVVQRLGVDYEAVRAVNPSVIYCAITGYGQTGPLKDRAGHDLNYLSESGALDLIGQVGEPPTIPGIQIADIAGGAMNAAIGILLAIVARNRTGQGQYIDISMTDGMAGFLMLPRFLSQAFGKSVKRSQNLLSHRYACYNTYETQDGRYVAVGALEPVFWQRLCEILETPELIPLQFDETQREVVISRFRELFLSQPAAHWQQLLEHADVCCSVVKTMDEALAGELYRSREMVVAVADSQSHGGDAIGIPIKLSRTPGAVRSHPDAFGQSTEAILLDLGYSRDEIIGFKQDKII